MQLPQQQPVDFSHAIAQVRARQLRLKGGQKLPPPKTPKKWPPDYTEVLAWRQMQLARFELEPALVESAKEYYAEHMVEFINHWCTTYDPRRLAKQGAAHIPLILFQRQIDLTQFVVDCLQGEASGLVEKSRDMGATWVCCAVSVWLWLFWPGVAIGWGSASQDKLDRIDVPGSIFEKLRMLIRQLPPVFLPKGFDDHCLMHMKVINPETGSTITGEIGDKIGRGDRTLIYFVDEAAHLAHPELVEASLLGTTRTRIDISSVSGLGTIFHRKRESGEEWESGKPVTKEATNIFIFDWRDHPERTKEWYESEKKSRENSGLAHVFAREVDRNYAASVEGVIIRPEWIKAAIDAHEVLNFDDSGGWTAGLDVADSGQDRNAFAKRKGSILKTVDEWGERDTGATARRAVSHCEHTLPLELEYDCIGVGAGVKAETNRLRDENLLPEGLRVVPWAASAAVLGPLGRLIEGDKNSPINKDFFANLKAQGWWMLARRFENTYRAIMEGISFDPDFLISIPASLPKLRQVEKELAQATMAPSSRMKMVVDKSPEGTKSPNIADAIVMAFWPVVQPMMGRISISGPMVVRADS